MFLEYYGLHEQPFGVTPDPRFLYFSPSHREALASLYYGIETGRGFLALTAEPGMGKTTLLFHLLEKLRGSARTAFIFRTQCDSGEFLRLLMSDLGYSSRDNDLIHLQEQLNDILVRESRSGSRCVVVVDEAQNLTDSVLETVRMLSNFETSRTKLMQILLAGQPELADKLASPNLIQLRQRVSILSRLSHLSVSETAGYVDHRLRVAGYSGKPLFTPGAMAVIASGSEGIPRNINNICFHTLTLGFARDQRVLGAALAEEVLADLDVTTLASASASDTEGACSPLSKACCPSVEEIMTALDSPQVVGTGSAYGVQPPDSFPSQLMENQPAKSHSLTDDWASEPIRSSSEAPEEALVFSGGSAKRPKRRTLRVFLLACLVLAAGLLGALGPRGWKSFTAHAETTFGNALTKVRLRWAGSTPVSSTQKPRTHLYSDPHPANAARDATPGDTEMAGGQLGPALNSSEIAVSEAKPDPSGASGTKTLSHAAVQRPSGRDATALRLHRATKRPMPNRRKAELADKLAAATYYYDRGEYTLALDLFEAALKVDPSSERAKIGIARALEANSDRARLSKTLRPAL